jgi:hypothetical protein
LFCPEITAETDSSNRPQVADTNTKFLTERLYLLGVKVEKIAVVPDKVSLGP